MHERHNTKIMAIIDSTKEIYHSSLSHGLVYKQQLRTEVVKGSNMHLTDSKVVKAHSKSTRLDKGIRREAYEITNTVAPTGFLLSHVLL